MLFDCYLVERREDGGLQAVQKFFEEKLRTGDDFASVRWCVCVCTLVCDCALDPISELCQF